MASKITADAVLMMKSVELEDDCFMVFVKGVNRPDKDRKKKTHSNPPETQ